ncbi:unnamed protein product [Parnassius apollo]|uniref:(apollo) hypothetical protein n=1 Tax=Parnassius apollo TaxID=110799 RepID=A0A8S3W1X9_PARAO|nr:unnamed protein product [Parnassius apollo]
MTKTCAGCSANLRKEYLVCHNCNDSYDLLCANLTQNKFSLMSKDNKNTWIFHASRCKIPKHDNTNTLVRISTSKPSNTSPAPPNSDHSNVIMRYKSRQGVPDNQISGSSNTSLWDSQLEDKHVSTVNNLYMEEIRGIVRDEFNIAFSHFETNLLKNMEIKNNELIERVEQLTTSLNFFEIKYEEIRANVQTKNELLKKLEHENKELKSSFADFSARLATNETPLEG